MSYICASKLAIATNGYWEVSYAVNHPEGIKLTMETCMNILGGVSVYVYEDRKVAKLAHNLKFDLIEGDSKWRNPSKKNLNSKLIPFTRR